jgi:hypothetical protein
LPSRSCVIPSPRQSLRLKERMIRIFIQELRRL